MAAEEDRRLHQGKRSRIGGENGDGLFSPEDDLASERKLVVAPWHHHPSSRIYRVSRASGGKDRHSKVVTAKGIRDRRVRLSVATAIQFYDLQDRLGLDQPSKAIEWLIKAASSAIDKLPSLDGAFAEAAKQVTVASAYAIEHGGAEGQPVTPSGQSSTSETSKGSVLSLSRSDTRAKARERARERAVKEKEVDAEDPPRPGGAASFTQLLTCHGGAVTTAYRADEKRCWQLAHAPDYLGQTSSLLTHQRESAPASPGFTISGAAHFAGGIAQLQIAPAAAPYGFSLQAAPGEMSTPQFSFLQDQLIPTAAAAARDYSLGISVMGANRGTLQSNAHSQPQFLDHHHQHLHRLPAPLDGTGNPFFFGAPAAPQAAASTAGDTNHFTSISGLQLWDGCRRADFKETGKN